jgi:hypothetical protein
MMGTTEKTVTAQGVFTDYEFNTKNLKEIPRSITDSKGNKFNQDMILTTSKAVMSIAYREAVLKGGVPGALWDPSYQQAKLTAVGKAISHSARIDAAMEYLTKLGVSEWQICNSVGVTSPKELEIDHLVTLKALCEEIKKGVRTIEEVFGSPYDKEIDSLFTQLGKNETEKRLLKNSYMGRAKELVEYLRERITPTRQTVGKQASSTTEQASKTEASTEQAKSDAPQETEQKKRRGRPKGSVKVVQEPSEEVVTSLQDTENASSQASTQQETFGSKGEENSEQTATNTTNAVPEAGRFSF